MNVIGITKTIIARLSDAGRVKVDKEDRIVNADESYNRGMRKLNEKANGTMTIDDLAAIARKQLSGLVQKIVDEEEGNNEAYESFKRQINNIVSEEVKRTLRNKKR